MLNGACPSCGFVGQIEAFLVDPEARRAVARAAALDAAIGKVLPGYLRLFGTGKRGVTMTRAVRLIDELSDLVATGWVCRDERVGVRRPTSALMWAQAMEQMIAAPPSGPLQNHHYLRSVVFGLADKADAQRERTAETQVKSRVRGATNQPTRLDPMANAQAWAKDMVSYGQMTQEAADAYLAETRSKLETTDG